MAVREIDEKSERLAIHFGLFRNPGHVWVPVLAAEPGFEPEFLLSESRVLPLHHSALIFIDII